MTTKPQLKPSAVQPLAYRISDATLVLGIGKSKLYQLAADGQLKLTKIGGRTVITRSELERLLLPAPVPQGAGCSEIGCTSRQASQTGGVK